MNTLLDRLPGAASAIEGARCFHCGEAVPLRTHFSIFFDGHPQPLCCAGCEAVAKTILEGGLDAYYRTRTSPAIGRAVPTPADLAALDQFDLPGIREQFSATAADSTHDAHATLMLEGITCAACIWLAEQQLRRIPGMVRVSVNFATRRAEVAWSAQVLTLAGILRAIRKIGLDAHPAEMANVEVNRTATRKKALRARWELFVAAFSTMQVMMYTVPLYLADPAEITPDIRSLMQWAGFALTVPVLLFSAQSIFRSAIRCLSAQQVNMDVPVALAILLTFASSVGAMLTGSGEVYFDSISMFVFLLLGTRFLESNLRHRGLAELERLAHAIPAVAERLDRYPTDTTGHDIASARLIPGDVVRVATGATIPADGEIIEGASEVDEALISGESRLLPKWPGDTVIGGAVNAASPLIVRVTEVGKTSTLARIVSASEAAMNERPRILERTSAIAARLAYATLIVAALASLGWLWFDPNRAFGVTVAVLAITCPCALALAVPAAIVVASGAAARAGLIFKRGHTLDTLSHVTDVVLDKTGTLTTGHMRVEAIEAADPDEALAIAAALEQGASHPIGRAIREAAARRHTGTKLAANLHQTERGVEGVIDGEAYRLGALETDAEANDPSKSIPQSRVALFRAGQRVGIFSLSDAFRGDAAAFTDSLIRKGLRIHLLSGDQGGAVADCAQMLGLSRWQARLSPEDKRRYVATLQKDGCIVLAVGDGINDAPLLAQADAGIAIATGTDLARTQADAVLLSMRLMPIALALNIARATRNVIRQNLVWAVLYNVIAVPLAVAGWVTPWLAALGMSLSALIVLGNSARIAWLPRNC